MRANGTRTPREQKTELKRIDKHVSSIYWAIESMDLHYKSNEVSVSVAIAWNALHDAVTALEAERRTVELNAPHADATAVLVHQNID